MINQSTRSIDFGTAEAEIVILNSPAERHNLGFDVTSPQGPLHLHGGDRVHGVSSPDGVGARLR
jgi:hypothetical protein